MLTPDQADEIATNCIRQGTGFDGQIFTDSDLNTVGVLDKDFREAVNDKIVNDTGIGVQHFGHTLEASDLTFTTTSKYFQLRKEIRNKAKPAGQNDNIEGILLAVSENEKKKDKPKKLKSKQDKKNKSKKEEEKV